MAESTDQENHRPWPEHAQGLRVGDVRVDLLHRRVERPDGHAELPHRMFELLLLFLAEPHVLHTRARLFERVWSGVVVEDANLSQSVWMLRKALGPERKSWIRTVARSGYVFEPPTPVQQECGPPVQSSDETVAARPPSPSVGLEATARKTGLPELPPQPVPAEEMPPSTAATPRIPWRLAWAAVLLAGLGLAWLHHHTTLPPPTQAPVAIALIEVGDNAASGEARWPAKLLHAWLGWKLAHLPEAIVLTEAHLAADASTLSPTVVLLSSGHSPTRPGEIFVRANLGQGTHGEQLELRGTAEQLPALVDMLSQQVIKRLMPARADASWPELGIDAATARSYGDAHDALKARDWPAAVGAMQDVVRSAPRFGLARFELAIAQSHLGQSVAAREHMATARELLTPVPDDAQPVLEALTLAIDPQQRSEAADAYGALASAWPQRTGFALEQARLLVQAGRSDEALAMLSQPVWDQQPAGLRITRQLTLAQAGMMRDDYERARADATIAEQMALAAGPGWALERARALLMMAAAGNILDRGEADLSLYEQAAQQFELAGSSVNATLARFQAGWARDPGDVENPLLDALLAETHAGGYHNLEITILRQVAFSHSLAGRHGQYRQRLEQALATANASGDLYRQNQLDLDLLNEDLLQGNFANADQRAERLRNGLLQGDAAAWVGQFDAYLHQLRGDTGMALATLDRVLQRAAQDGTSTLPPISIARLACVRADFLLEQGQSAAARAELAHCSEHDQPTIRQLVTMITAKADLLAGNRAAALAGLQALQADIDENLGGPDRWWLSLGQAYLMTRSGEPEQAHQLYEQTLPQVRKANYRWLEALTLAGLAEVAAARGDWNESTYHLAAARRITPDNAWLLTRRLDQVAIVLALAGNDMRLALERLSELDARAHRFGDTLTVLEVHSLMSPDMHLEDCDRSTRASMLAKTGFRGAGLDWLTASLQASQNSTLSLHDTAH